WNPNLCQTAADAKHTHPLKCQGEQELAYLVLAPFVSFLVYIDHPLVERIPGFDLAVSIQKEVAIGRFWMSIGRMSKDYPVSFSLDCGRWKYAVSFAEIASLNSKWGG